MFLCTVNENGAEVIKQFLLENHKRPEDATTPAAIAQYIALAEDRIDINFGDVVVDILAQDCVHDKDLSLILDNSCFDSMEMTDGS